MINPLIAMSGCALGVMVAASCQTDFAGPAPGSRNQPTVASAPPPGGGAPGVEGGRDLHRQGSATASFTRSPSWPELPALLFEPPTRGYGASVVEYGMSIGAYPWPTIRNYMVRGGDRYDYELSDRDRRRFVENLDELVPADAPVVFLDLEDHVKLYNKPDTSDATRNKLIAYNRAIVNLAKSERPQTRFAIWNHPNREQVIAHQTEEWRHRQWAWAPLIKQAGACSANCFIWWNDVERDLEWMVPYLKLCLEITNGEVPVYATVSPGQQGKMNPVSKQTLEAIWSRLAEVEVNGHRIAGFDLYMTYYDRNPEWDGRGDSDRKRRPMTPGKAADHDELLKWSMDTLMKLAAR